MNEQNSDQSIRQMLNDGHSYSEIAKRLGVSSKTIARVNAQRKAQESIAFQLSHDRKPYKESFQVSKVVEESTFQDSVEDANEFPNLKSDKLPNESPGAGKLSEAEIKLEELRITKEFELRMRQFEWMKEKQERELMLRDEEFLMKRRQLETENNKVNQIRTSFVFRFKKVVSKCREGAWNYEDLNRLYEDVIDLYNDAEQYATVNSLPFAGTEYEQAVDQLYEYLDKLIEDRDEDDIINWYNYSLIRELKKHAASLTFNLY